MRRLAVYIHCRRMQCSLSFFLPVSSLSSSIKPLLQLLLLNDFVQCTGYYISSRSSNAVRIIEGERRNLNRGIDSVEVHSPPIVKQHKRHHCCSRLIVCLYNVHNPFRFICCSKSRSINNLAYLNCIFISTYFLSCILYCVEQIFSSCS